MICIKNGKQIFIDKTCKINTTKLWLKNNKNIEIEENSKINCVTSWYYKNNKIVNKGTITVEHKSPT